MQSLGITILFLSLPLRSRNSLQFCIKSRDLGCVKFCLPVASLFCFDKTGKQVEELDYISVFFVFLIILCESELDVENFMAVDCTVHCHRAYRPFPLTRGTHIVLRYARSQETPSRTVSLAYVHDCTLFW